MHPHLSSQAQPVAEKHDLADAIQRRQEQPADARDGLNVAVLLSTRYEPSVSANRASSGTLTEALSHPWRWSTEPVATPLNRSYRYAPYENTERISRQKVRKEASNLRGSKVRAMASPYSAPPNAGSIPAARMASFNACLYRSRSHL